MLLWGMMATCAQKVPHVTDLQNRRYAPTEVPVDRVTYLLTTLGKTMKYTFREAIAAVHAGEYIQTVVPVSHGDLLWS